MTRSRLQPTRRFLAIASVATLACIAVAVADGSGGKPSPESPLVSRGRSLQDAPPPDEHGARPPRPEGERRGGDRDRGWGWRPGNGPGDFGGPPRGRMFDDADVLKVIRDIAPEQAARVEENLKTKPEETRDYLRRNARRIMGLVALSKNNPKLYNLKVEELKLQAKARVQAIEYHDKVAAGQLDDAERAKARLRDACRAAINAGIRSRGEELAALTEAVRVFKQDLERDARNISQDTERLVGELIEHRPEGGMFSGIGGEPPPPPPPSQGIPAGPPVDTAPTR